MCSISHNVRYDTRDSRIVGCCSLPILPHAKLGFLPHSCSKSQSAAGFTYVTVLAAGSPDEPSNTEAGFLSHLRNALMAEVSGLVENIQEVCALIRADATELGNPAPSDSPRRQANEVLFSSWHP